MSAGEAHDSILTQAEATRARAAAHAARKAAVAQLLADIKRRDPHNLPGEGQAVIQALAGAA